MTGWLTSLLVLSTAFAGPTEPRPTPIDFAGAVALAARNNADLRAAGALYAATAEQEGVARAGYLPTVTGTLGYSESGGSQSAPGAVDQNGSYTASLTANQNLFAGLQTMGARAQARANTGAAAATLQTTKARVSADLVAAFAAAVYARESRKLNEDIIRRREENLRLVTLRFQSGRENQGSVLLSRAYLGQARYDHLQSTNAVRVSGAQLARAIGTDDQGAVEVVGDVPITDPGAAPAALGELATATPDYALARAQAEAADAGVTVARAGFFPQLALSASTNRYGPDFFPDQRDRWAMGASLTLPLFNGGKDWFGLRAAAASRTAGELARVNVGRQTLAKLEQAWASYVESAAKLEVDDAFRRAATLRAEIARKKYNNGLQTFDDWDVIENDLITRQKTYVQTKRDRTTAEAAWTQALGKGVF